MCLIYISYVKSLHRIVVKLIISLTFDDNLNNSDMSSCPCTYPKSLGFQIPTDCLVFHHYKCLCFSLTPQSSVHDVANELRRVTIYKDHTNSTCCLIFILLNGLKLVSLSILTNMQYVKLYLNSTIALFSDHHHSKLN